MSVEQRLRELAEIQRPFSHLFPARRGDAYLVDDTFCFRRVVGYYEDMSVEFVADMQLQIVREKSKTERIQFLPEDKRLSNSKRYRTVRNNK